MKIKVLFMTLALILVVLISGCKKNDYQATVGVCPIVVSTIPANGAVGVPINQVVSATFNEKMNAATITSSTFTVIDATKSAGLKAAVVVTGTLTYSGMTSFFTPSSPLSPNTTYTGRMTTAARDLTGNALQADYVWTFTTDLPPTVTTDPANNATDVLLNKVIVATFSVPMDSLTIKSPATIFTIKQGTTTVPGKFSYTSTTASFTPTNSLAPFTIYTGTITTGAKNKLGTPMAADYVWNFTTIPQLTLLSNPALGGTTSGAGVFAQGSSVTVVATANLGYTFFNWTEGTTVVSTSASYQFTMAGNKTLVANFTPKYLVTVLSNPILGGTTSGGGSFTSGTTVIVTAVPSAGFTFTNWTENGTIVSAAPAIYTFTISGNRTLVANYTAIPYTVAVSTNPSTLLNKPTGGGTFNSGSSVTVTALANTGYTFTNWTENGIIVSAALAEYTFTISGNRTLVANYTLIGGFNVTVSSNPLAGGSTTGGGSFISGASVTVSALANAGYTFTNWTEGVNIVSTLGNYTFTITGNRTFVANYAKDFTLTVTAINGSVLKNPNQLTYPGGTSVQLRALPNYGFTFTSWSVDASGSDNPLTITMNSDKAITANFTAIPSAALFTSRFGLFGGTAGMTNQGTLTQIVDGDIGTIATGTSAITGFHDSNGDIYTETGSNIGGVSGQILSCTVSTTGPTSAGVNAANCEAATVGLVAIQAAYDALAGMPVSGVLLPENLSGLTVAAGVYKAPAGSFMIQDGLSGPAGNLTLSGTATDVWVFQMATTLTVGGPGAAFPRSVILTGGALAKNVYWQVGSAATINAGGGGTMVGNIIAMQGVSISTSGNVDIVTLNGRALSLVASVTLVNTIINVPAP